MATFKSRIEKLELNQMAGNNGSIAVIFRTGKGDYLKACNGVKVNRYIPDHRDIRHCDLQLFVSGFDFDLNNYFSTN